MSPPLLHRFAKSLALKSYTVRATFPHSGFPASISVASPSATHFQHQTRSFQWIEYVADIDELGSNNRGREYRSNPPEDEDAEDDYTCERMKFRNSLNRGLAEGWVSNPYSAGNNLDRIEDSEGIKPRMRRYEKPTSARRKYRAALAYKHSRAKIENITQWIDYEKGRRRPP
uniref:Uncharacterized protein n=1 Tax=Corethron hystrix TaxID=216773 RepID=A0A7S1FXQ3_9STRA|mmetsp:Transcript_40282/g.94653  ORF Transcript_40282/g.94653 Transcript_40282/m.94653 type:complete len:172 (+) Transcript_40282:74-589(+)